MTTIGPRGVSSVPRQDAVQELAGEVVKSGLPGLLTDAIRQIRANLNASRPPVAAPVDQMDKGPAPLGAAPNRAIAPTADSVAQVARQNVASLRSSISKLENEISDLSHQNRVKAAYISATLQKIEERKNELEQQRRSKSNVGILGALLGMPAVTVVSVVQVGRDDDRIRALEASLTSLRSEQAAIQARSARASATVKTLRGELATLKEQELELGPVNIPTAARNFADVARVARELENNDKLVKNLRAQVAILQRVKTVTGSVAVDLQRVLERAVEAEASARRLLAASIAELDSLVKILGEQDPNHAAIKWLANSAAAQIVGAGSANETAAEKEVRKRLTDKVAAVIVG